MTSLNSVAFYAGMPEFLKSFCKQECREDRSPRRSQSTHNELCIPITKQYLQRDIPLQDDICAMIDAGLTLGNIYLLLVVLWELGILLLFPPVLALLGVELR
jgi:hypothetical protein